jgi:hypothetical protein
MGERMMAGKISGKKCSSPERVASVDVCMCGWVMTSIFGFFNCSLPPPYEFALFHVYCPGGWEESPDWSNVVVFRIQRTCVQGPGSIPGGGWGDVGIFLAVFLFFNFEF